MSANFAKISDLSPDQQIIALRSICETQHVRIHELQMELQQEKGGKLDEYYKVMTKRDRLFNRLIQDLVLTDQGIPEHDHEGRNWLSAITGTTP